MWAKSSPWALHQRAVGLPRVRDGQIPHTDEASYHVASFSEALAQSAIEPDWIALAAFALIAAIAALIIAAQAIARQIRAGLGDSQVLRGIGAAPAMIAADSLTGSWAQSF